MAETTRRRRARREDGVTDITPPETTEEDTPVGEDVELPGMPARPAARFAAIDGVVPDRWGVSLSGSWDYPQHDAPALAEDMTHSRKIRVTIEMLDADGDVDKRHDPLTMVGSVKDIAHPTKTGKRIGKTVVRMVKLKVGGKD